MDQVLVHLPVFFSLIAVVPQGTIYMTVIKLSRTVVYRILMLGDDRE